jgi:hypothetical protein
MMIMVHRVRSHMHVIIVINDLIENVTIYVACMRCHRLSVDSISIGGLVVHLRTHKIFTQEGNVRAAIVSDSTNGNGNGNDTNAVTSGTTAGSSIDTIDNNQLYVNSNDIIGNGNSHSDIDDHNINGTDIITD